MEPITAGSLAMAELSRPMEIIINTMVPKKASLFIIPSFPCIRFTDPSLVDFPHLLLREFFTQPRIMDQEICQGELKRVFTF
jgi:hypothetical protein